MQPKKSLSFEGLKETREENVTLVGRFEIRHITKCKVDSTILKAIFSSKCPTKISFNLMMMTSDHKVLLLERTQSFHFSRCLKSVKMNTVNLSLFTSLYSSELEKIRLLFFDYIPPLTSSNSSEKIIKIFPGGHFHKLDKSIFFTLIRELKEETSLNIDSKNLWFNQSCIFNVLIFDLLVRRTFNNFVFPVKVNMTSDDILQNFKETKHTRNPTFVDICDSKNLFDVFKKIQSRLLL